MVEDNPPTSRHLHRLTRLYIKVLVVIYLGLIVVALVAESGAVDLRFVVYIVIFGALSVVMGGSVFYIVIILPGWAIYRAVGRFARKPTQAESINSSRK